jgi:hypothetical protein
MTLSRTFALPFALPLALAALALSGCGEKLPSGEPALREAMGAISGQPAGSAVSATWTSLATDMAELPVSLAAGFAGEPLASQWDEKALAAKVAAALKPNEKRLDDTFFAALAKALPAETTQQLVADTRDPARLAALKCAYKPDGMRFAIAGCDMTAMGEPNEWGLRYVALKAALDKTSADPVVLGIVGTAACEVSDEFLAAAKKANPQLIAGALKINRGGTSYDCAAFRKMAGGG